MALTVNKHGAVSISIPSVAYYRYETSDGITESVAYPVNGISSDLFGGCTGVKSVSLPSCITELPTGAFRGCTGLRTVSLPSGITVIPGDAFCGCSSLTSVSIPSPVTSIGSCAFSGCSSMTTLPSLANITKIEYGAFAGTGITSLNVPGHIKEIGYGAFSDCKNLKTAVINTGTETMGTSLFSGCTALEELTLPFAARNIADVASDVSVSGSISDIICDVYRTSNTQYLRDNGYAIHKITILGGESIPHDAFYDMTMLDEVVLPDTIQVIGSQAFYGCTGLKNLMIYQLDCVIPDSASTFDPAIAICSWSNSTAQQYAKKYDRSFKNLGTTVYTVNINGIKTTSFVDAETVLTSNQIIPANPYMDGYVFKGWTVNGTLYTTANAVRNAIAAAFDDDPAAPITVDVSYEKKTEMFTVNVSGGRLANGQNGQKYQVSTLMHVTANAPGNGKHFSHWLRNGKKVSTNSTYSFYMPSENVSLVAVYADNTSSVSQTGTAIIESVTASSNKLSFVSVLNVPKNCKFVKGGLVATNNASIGVNVDANNATFVKLSTKATANSKNVKYTWTKSGVGSGTWYVRGYLVY
ncbi:MAG: leucine-rich repeat protein, partial [Oscillospiraceae bacterium]|nr:leucine-rich repeat protein [Oscillospiraceae bacterium]